MSNNTIEQLIDRFVYISQEKARLEEKIKAIQRQLQPPKSVVELKNQKLFLN